MAIQPATSFPTLFKLREHAGFEQQYVNNAQTIKVTCSSVQAKRPLELVGPGGRARWESLGKAQLNETLDDYLISSTAAATLEEINSRRRESPLKRYRLRDGIVHECKTEIVAQWYFAKTPRSRPQAFKIAPGLPCDVVFGKAYAAEKKVSDGKGGYYLAPLYMKPAAPSKKNPLTALAEHSDKTQVTLRRRRVEMTLP